MHSCLTLVDYTWKDSDESENSTSLHSKSNNLLRLKRSAQSLDGKSLNCLLRHNHLHHHCYPHHHDRLLRPVARTSFRHHSENMRQNSSMGNGQKTQQSTFLLCSRRLPIYLSTRRLLNEPDRVWVPVGHCRYLLERDSITREIKWSSETNELLCSPRCLVGICMARLIRDWPCMLPPRRSSLRNMVNFLFNSKELQTSTSGTNCCALTKTNPSVGLGSHCKTSYNRENMTKVSSSSKTILSIPHSSLSSSSSKIPPTNATSIVITYHDLPITLLVSLLSEAILQRDCAAITVLVANWPAEKLSIGDLIPNEEYPLTQNYMSKPTFVLVSSDHESFNRNTLVKGPSLLDAFILGFLTRQAVCKLNTVDFTGFEDDCRVSIELSRLPILWMKPENRNSETVRRHLMTSLIVGIPQKRLEAYFGRISTIYAYHKEEIGRGELFETLTIHLDCNMTVDEVALGLSLQTLTPFRFSCNRLLLQRLPEIYFPPYSLIRLFNPLTITQFELEDPTLGSSLAVILPSAVGWLISLRNLRACSLPSCIPPPPEVNILNSTTQSIGNLHRSSIQFPSNLNNMVQTSTTSNFTSNVAACKLLNRALVSLRYLQRLGLARCHLTGQLKTLLGGLRQPLEYLNLQDCCLSSEDIHYLVHQWRPLNGLYELNLSRNNLSTVPDETLHQLVQNTCFKPEGHVMCLSIAYTCLSTEHIIWLLSLMARMDTSKNLTKSKQTQKQNQQPKNPVQNQDDYAETSSSDKWTDRTCTLRVLCIQSFIPPACDQIHRILYRVTRLPKLHKLHLFPAFYAFLGNNESNQRELRINQLNQSKNYLRQRSRADIEIL